MPILEDRSDQSWGLTHTAMATPTQFPARVPTTIPPLQVTSGVTNTGDGVIPAGAGPGQPSVPGLVGPVRFLIVPFGNGPTGSIFSMNVYGWRATGGSNAALAAGSSNVKAWIPILLATYNVTLGSVTGAQGGDVSSSLNFAGTITQSYGVTTATSSQVWDQFVLSPGSTGIAMIGLRALGFQYLEITFQLNSAFGANCLRANF